MNFKRPWALNYLGEFGTTSEASLWNVITDRLLSLPLVQERLLQLLLPPGVWALHDEPLPVEKLG